MTGNKGSPPGQLPEWILAEIGAPDEELPFRLARVLRTLALTDGMEAEPEALVAHYRGVIADVARNDAIRPVLGDFYGGDLDELCDEVIPALDLVRFPAGIDPLELAAYEAARHPVTNPPIRRAGPYCRLLSLAAHLDRLTNGGPILLPCHRTGRVLGLSKERVSRLRTLLEMDGYLTVVRRHNRNRHRATLFRFIGRNRVHIGTEEVRNEGTEIFRNASSQAGRSRGTHDSEAT